MKNSLLTLLLLVGLSFLISAQTPATGLEGSWQGALAAGGQTLRLVVTLTKSEAGIYAGKLDSVDQGAILPIDTVTVTGDAVRWEIKSLATLGECSGQLRALLVQARARGAPGGGVQGRR